MKLLIGLQEKIMFISSIIILFGLTLAVILRYVLKIDLFAIEELLVIPTFLLYFIGSAHGSYENSHISADMTDTFVKSEKIKSLVHLFVSIITLISCLIITYWNSQYLAWSFNSGGTTSGYGIPLYIPHGTVFLGFILMAFYSVIHVFSKTRNVVNEFKK